MAGPHSHPGYRERGTYTQKQWEEIKAQERAAEQAKFDEWARANPEEAAKVETRCASMIAELEADDSYHCSLGAICCGYGLPFADHFLVHLGERA